MSTRRHELLICLAFALLFGVCYGFTSWWTVRHATSLPAWDMPFERHLPFVPSLSLVYLTITPALLLAPFLLRRERTASPRIAPLAIALSVETLVASTCFLLFPQTTAFQPRLVTGWARLPFALADALNLDYNTFPSLHVAFACSAAWAYATTRRRAIFWITWSVAVAASTLLMHEHHLADIAAGALLAAASMSLVYTRLDDVELLCLRECVRFSRRHLRYFVIFVMIYTPSCLHWRRYRAVRAGYCAAQWIDDLLDGDRPSSREPLELVDDLVVEMTHNTFSPQPLSRLVAALFAELDEPARREFIQLVLTMRRDRVRVLRAEVWEEDALDAHHRVTFSLSVNLLLATTRCHARAEQVPSLVEALAWCSVFRDLDDDLRKGLVNIPGGADVEQWTRDAHARASVALARSRRDLAQLADPRARRILGIFQSSVEKYARTRRQAATTLFSDAGPSPVDL
jgi:membrane-associated phospholipid phosphatase